MNTILDSRAENNADSDVLEFFCGNEDILLKTAIIAAHPDDEVIGASSRLPLLKNVYIVHTTDGAPRNMLDARASGFHNLSDYAAARRKELFSALEIAGVPPNRCLELGFKDQEASFNLIELSKRLEELLRELRPEIILTHAYEGGHPDHDSTAFAVHTACASIYGKGFAPPLIVEFTSYHDSRGSIVTSEFLSGIEARTCTILLSEEEKAIKKRMVDCFVTQKNVLTLFKTEKEAFRFAPAYDFIKPPHEGTLYYEHFDWGIDGKSWRRLAAEALELLNR
ncbi:MAG: PIG-L family deacetylase [Ignavibacteria bacterium]|nr:PIG-L family deacetylase [Ignavibacteria bacterium]MCU7502195.1 PIG-L family deacetylase [Ignavibacteria bacterium]MCU7517412.1 PIG-L family deacetylase [Ignavibacteria bacterium]